MASGRFSTVEDVIGAATEALRRRDDEAKLAALRVALEEGEKSGRSDYSLERVRQVTLEIAQIVVSQRNVVDQVLRALSSVRSDSPQGSTHLLLEADQPLGQVDELDRQLLERSVHRCWPRRIQGLCAGR